jgi:hypothetical protein
MIKQNDLVKLIKVVYDLITRLNMQGDTLTVTQTSLVIHLKEAEKKASDPNPDYSWVKYRLEKVLEIVLIDLDGEAVILPPLEKAIELTKQSRSTLFPGEYQFPSLEPILENIAIKPGYSAVGLLSKTWQDGLDVHRPKLVLRSESETDEQERQDVTRIVLVFFKYGYELDRLTARDAWREHSEVYSAGWMLLPEEDDRIYKWLMPYLKEV